MQFVDEHSHFKSSEEAPLVTIVLSFHSARQDLCHNLPLSTCSMHGLSSFLSTAHLPKNNVEKVKLNQATSRLYSQD